MEVSPKEMRKLLNAAWDKGCDDGGTYNYYYRPGRKGRRYRDVSRILQEAKKKEQRVVVALNLGKDGRDDKKRN